MPIYEYKCRRCGCTFDVLQRLGENGTNLFCPECGGSEPERMFSAFASNRGGGEAFPSGGCSSGFG